MRERINVWCETFKDIWPLIPAALYLLTFFTLVLFYLFQLAFVMPDGLVSFEPFKDLMMDEKFHQALQNSFFYVLIGTPLQLLVGLILAMLVFRAYMARSLVRSLFTIPFAIPGIIVATFLFILFDSQGGFINHLLRGAYPIFPAVIDRDIDWRGTREFALGISLFGKMWRDMPITMLILLSGLNAIDPSVIDAAKTLGAGFRVRFFRIILPMLFPAITTVLLLRSIEMWKEFMFPYILARRYHLLGTLIESLYQQHSAYYTAQAAAIAIVLVISVVATLVAIFFIMKVLQRLFIDSGQYD